MCTVLAQVVQYLLQTSVVTVATLPDGSPVEAPVRRYRFSYIFSNGSTIVDYVLSEDCVGGTCTSRRTFVIPATSQVLRVSVAAENVIGVGDSSERNVSSK